MLSIMDLNLHPFVNLLLKAHWYDVIICTYLFCGSQPWAPLFILLLILLSILMLLLRVLESVFIAVLTLIVHTRPDAASLITDFTADPVSLLFLPLSVSGPGLSHPGEAFQLLQGGGAEAACSSTPPQLRLWRKERESFKHHFPPQSGPSQRSCCLHIRDAPPSPLWQASGSQSSWEAADSWSRGESLARFLGNPQSSSEESFCCRTRAAEL